MWQWLSSIQEWGAAVVQFVASTDYEYDGTDDFLIL